jgi:hypothetical protein
LPGASSHNSGASAGECRCRLHHRRQRPIRHGDLLCGVTRLIARLGNNECNRIADVPYPLTRQCRARRHDERRDRRDLGNARQGSDAVCIHIGRGENAADARHRTGTRGIDAFYYCMSVR